VRPRGRLRYCWARWPGVHAVHSAIREAKTSSLHSIMETGGKRGMQTMEAALATLVKEGLVEREIALRAAIRQEALHRLLSE